MQAMGRKQTEMMTQTLQVMQAAGKDALSGSANPAAQTEVVGAAFEKTLADMKELAEMARRSIDLLAWG